MIGKTSGKAVARRDLPEVAFVQALGVAGLPQEFSDMLADSDAGASKGGLFDDGHQLSAFIGYATVAMSVQLARVVG